MFNVTCIFKIKLLFDRLLLGIFSLYMFLSLVY